jgi:hypothetical protein
MASTLIERLKERAADPHRAFDMLPYVVTVPAGASLYRRYPPVTKAELRAAEARLGFAFPPLFRRVYLEVGNGGFGPGYGLLGLTDRGPQLYDKNLVDWYIVLTTTIPAEHPQWPRQYITLCDWGCNITSVLDWTNPQGPILRHRGDRGTDNVLVPEASSLQKWLEDWLEDKVAFDKRARL